MFIKDEVQNEIIIQKSRFITYLKPLNSIDEYREELKNLKKKHYDATHVCSAFIYDDNQKSSDDGEPSGTAGMPILNVLSKNEMNHIAAYVVRYFGGIKLGAGGLIRAYSSSVSEALKLAIKYIEVVYPSFYLSLSYDMANKIEHYLSSNTIDLKKEYTETVNYTFALDDINKLDKILEFTKGISPISIGDIKVKKVVD